MRWKKGQQGKEYKDDKEKKKGRRLDNEMKRKGKKMMQTRRCMWTRKEAEQTRIWMKMLFDSLYLRSGLPRPVVRSLQSAS